MTHTSWQEQVLAFLSLGAGFVVYRFVGKWMGLGVMATGAVLTLAVGNHFDPEPDPWPLFARKIVIIFAIGAVYIMAIVLPLRIEPFWLGFSISMVAAFGGFVVIQRYADRLDAPRSS